MCGWVFRLCNSFAQGVDEPSDAPSWVVGDDDDIVYSGTPPSQPLDIDAGFYRRVNNALNSPSAEPTPVAPAKRHRKKAAPTKRIKPAAARAEDADDGGDDDGDDDVIVFASQQPSAAAPTALARCLVCDAVTAPGQSVCQGCYNGLDALSPPPQVRRTRDKANKTHIHIANWIVCTP